MESPFNERFGKPVLCYRNGKSNTGEAGTLLLDFVYDSSDHPSSGVGLGGVTQPGHALPFEAFERPTAENHPNLLLRALGRAEEHVRRLCEVQGARVCGR